MSSDEGAAHPGQGFAVLGALGRADRDRVARAAAAAGLEGSVVLDQPGVTLYATGGRTRPWSGPTADHGVCWSTGHLPGSVRAGSWEDVARRHGACGVVGSGDGSWRVHTSISGADPLHVLVEDDAVYFSTRLEALIAGRDGEARADWDAWACTIGVGAPLDGRTPFADVRRLGPYVAVGTDGSDRPDWPWARAHEGGASELGEVRDALVAAVRRAIPDGAQVDALLSGGWDSRILAATAHRHVPHADHVQAWTTSSDIGTTLDELVARRVARRLGVDHTLVPPRNDRFPADLDRFCTLVEHQTSFHVWLTPLVERLRGRSGPMLDGLGGGIVLGGAFGDQAPGEGDTDSRFARLARYLDQSDEVLRPEVAAGIRERARERFEATVADHEDHPRAALLTAYLARTLPGIALAPTTMLAWAGPVAMPFLDDEVVAAALRLPDEVTRDGRAYPALLAALDPETAREPTAADLTGRREHVRRGASQEVAEHLRRTLAEGPVGPLLAPELRGADTARWQQLLGRTRPQHLLRGLAVLDSWLHRHDGELADADPTALLA